MRNDSINIWIQVFLEPLKRIQVEGIAMYAEPELLFGNLDELCGVTYAFCKEFIHLLLKLTDAAGDLSTTEILAKLFEPVCIPHLLILLLNNISVEQLHLY